MSKEKGNRTNNDRPWAISRSLEPEWLIQKTEKSKKKSFKKSEKNQTLNQDSQNNLQPNHAAQRKKKKKPNSPTSHSKSAAQSEASKGKEKPWATPSITPEYKFFDEEKEKKKALREQKRWGNLAKKKKKSDGIYISVQYAGDGKNMRGWIPMSKREYALWLQSNPEEKKQEWRLLYYSAGSLDPLHKTEADRQEERDRISKLSSATYHFDQGSKKKKRRRK